MYKIYFVIGLSTMLLTSSYGREAGGTLHATNVLTKNSGNVNIALGHVEGKSYVARIKAIHKLGTDLTAQEINAIYKFLYQKNSKLKPLEFNGLKNELVIVITNQINYPQTLTHHLCQMYNDKSLGTTWRDYCIQFLGQWYPRMQTSEEREMAKVAFASALKETDNGIAGTALISMKNLVGNLDFKKEQIADTAQRLAASSDVGYTTRIPALQISANLGNTEALSTAREIVSGEVPVMLKMSALAVMGVQGSQSDIETLRHYARSSDVRLRAAAVSALRKLAPQ